MHPEQKKLFQSMTPEQKLDAALSLYHSSRYLKAAAMRQQHPDWSDEMVEQKVREVFLYAQS